MMNLEKYRRDFPVMDVVAVNYGSQHMLYYKSSKDNKFHPLTGRLSGKYNPAYYRWIRNGKFSSYTVKKADCNTLFDAFVKLATPLTDPIAFLEYEMDSVKELNVVKVIEK